MFSPEETTERERAQYFERAPERAQLKLGTGEHNDKVWEKTYKLRITSKFSGRKLDVNVKFKQEIKNIRPNAAGEEQFPRDDVGLCLLELERRRNEE